MKTKTQLKLWRFPLLTLATGLITISHAASAQTIFEDDFSDGNRNGWYTFSSSSGTAPVVNQQLVLTAGTGSVAAITYFTPTTLAVGEKMTLTFDMSFSSFNSNNDQFRYGLFNSQGTQISADITSVSDSAFNGDRGYAAFMSYTNTPQAQSLRERTGSNDTFWSAGAFTSRASGNDNIGGTPDVARQYFMELELTAADSMTVTSGIEVVAGSIRTFTTSSPVSTIDSLVIFQGNDQANLTFDNFNVSVIPEPGTYALLGGLAALGIVMLRRRR